MKWTGQDESLANAERAEMLPMWLSDDKRFICEMFARIPLPKATAPADPNEPIPGSDDLDEEVA